MYIHLHVRACVLSWNGLLFLHYCCCDAVDGEEAEGADPEQAGQQGHPGEEG